MIKKETDARRELTSKDLETVDQAIASNEALGGFLYRSRYIIGEISKLEQHYRSLKEAIVVVEEQGRRVNAELQAAQSKLTEVQAQEVEVRKRIAAFTAEAAEKEQLLTSYSQTIDRITGKVAA